MRGSSSKAKTPPPERAAPGREMQPHRTGGRLVILGHVSGTYGVRGWLRINSYTRPPDNLLKYRSLLIGDQRGWVRYRPEQGRVHGRGLVVKLRDIDDASSAAKLSDLQVSVPRSAMPEPGTDEYYWCDLIGLKVLRSDGAELGEVTQIHETGANDVLVVEGAVRMLIPFITGRFIDRVDLDQGTIIADWDPVGS